MRWSVTVVDTNGFPVEVAFDSDEQTATITVQGDKPGWHMYTTVSVDQLRALVRVVAGWPLEAE